MKKFHEKARVSGDAQRCWLAHRLEDEEAEEEEDEEDATSSAGTSLGVGCTGQRERDRSSHRSSFFFFCDATSLRVAPPQLRRRRR